MTLNSVSALYFSPGGSTRAAARAVAAGAGGEYRDCDFTSRADSLGFGENDLVVFAAPVFGGRIPAPFASFLDSVTGRGSPAVRRRGGIETIVPPQAARWLRIQGGHRPPWTY